MVRINTNSAIYKLLRAKALKENGDPIGEKNKWNPTLINVYRNDITNNIANVTGEKATDTISNICYSLQFVELLIHMHEEIYMSSVIHRIINKQIIITISEIEQCLLSIKDTRLFGDKFKDQQNKKHNLSFKARIDLANDYRFIGSGLKGQLLTQREARNKVHVGFTDNDELVTDYFYFDDDKYVNECITGLNQLFNELSNGQSTAKFDLVTEQSR